MGGGPHHGTGRVVVFVVPRASFGGVSVTAVLRPRGGGAGKNTPLCGLHEMLFCCILVRTLVKMLFISIFYIRYMMDVLLAISSSSFGVFFFLAGAGGTEGNEQIIRRRRARPFFEF